MAFHDKRLRPFHTILLALHRTTGEDLDLQRQLDAEEARLIAASIEPDRIEVLRRDEFARFPR